MSEMKARIRAFAAEVLGVAPDTIADDTLLFTDHGDHANPGGLGDSLDRTEYAMMLEEEYGLEIPQDADKRVLATIDSAVAYLTPLVGGAVANG